MRIYRMTATFGKLEHATICFDEGMNIVQAPNEWGKSTWCAFLSAMLYGIETRAKSTKNSLADKEHYLPWSGSPMSGSMDVRWNDRDITIERRTKGRIPMGQFSAYETHSGVAVSELTAANCGEMLLGVERSVFLRSSFVRLSDLPVAQDETLRKRLNALVTTGDESGDAERLGTSLRELKNRCRYNRTGILPQAEAERAAIEGKLREYEMLEAESNKLSERMVQLEAQLRDLQIHKRHLAYAAAQEDLARVSDAAKKYESAQEELARAQKDCEAIGDRADAQQMLAQIQTLNAEGMALQMQSRSLPEIPEIPSAPEAFRDMDAQQACERARLDGERLRAMKKKMRVFAISSALMFALAIVCAFFSLPVAAAVAIVGGILAWLCLRAKGECRSFEAHYGTQEPSLWLTRAQEWAASVSHAQQARREAAQAHEMYRAGVEAWNRRIAEITNGHGLEAARRDCEQVILRRDTLSQAERNAQNAKIYYENLSAVVRLPEKPDSPDPISLSEAETEQRLLRANEEYSHLRTRLGQYEGRMEALGNCEALRTTLESCNTRIRKLEDIYAALTIAQQTLTEASLSLQRRFAPQIAKRAQELMNAFTGGRYERLALAEDMTLRSGAGNEDTLRDAFWRSDGTADQLYLSLRIAVSEALTPDAPLVLDDALVRFDDERLKATLEVLKTLQSHKQIILFTCQSREKQLMAQDI